MTTYDVSQPTGEPDSRLLIWYVEQDQLLGYDFSAGQAIQPLSDSGSGECNEEFLISVMG